MARRIVRGTGKTLIAVGVLLLLFVAYQLWGTGLAEKRNQRKLTAAFKEGQLGPPQETPAAPQPAPPAVPGEALALINIPKIGVEKAVIEGVGVADLKKGPGHYPDTPMPGEKGNSAIAGHRTTYGAPFYRLNELARDDEILITTRSARFRYTVVETKIVTPDQVQVLDPTPDNRLTLTTCHPRFSAAQRLIVVARLDEGFTPAVQPVAEPKPRPQAPVVDRAGLSGDRAARGPAAAWGSLAGFIWLAAWYAGYLWKRRWTAYAIAAPPFFVVLFVFYENVARLLPANV